MKFYKYFIFSLAFIPRTALSGETSYTINGRTDLLYGYSDVSTRYERLDKNNNYVGNVHVNAAVEHDFNEKYSGGIYIDLMAGSGMEIQNYTFGSWGKEIYGVLNTPYGQITGGETLNAAAQLQPDIPAYGPLRINNSAIVDFISNPNWYRRNHKYSSFKTLNSTAMNTDGSAAKISYYTPQIAHTILGFSYIPDTYSRTGLVSNYADYSRKDAYVAALYHEADLGFIETAISLGYGIYHKTDKDFTAAIAAYRGNCSAGASYRKTYVDGNTYHLKADNRNPRTPQWFDNYREGQAWSTGIGYRFGPYKASLSYFKSEADNTRNKDEIIMLANDFQVNKHLNIYAIAAHVNFKGEDRDIHDNNKGYAFVTGIGINF